MNTHFENHLKDKMGMNDSQIEDILPLLQKKTFKKTEFVLQEGQTFSKAYFIEKGLMRSYSIDEQGRQHIIQFAPENWFISDLSSSFFNEPSQFFIEAIEETVAFVLNERFAEYISGLPAYNEKNEQLLQNHIRHLQSRINLLLGATAEARYLEFIRLYPNITLRVPQWMIASYLGITPESLSRVRKDLADPHYKT